jgi:uncharacterized protein
VQATVVVLTKVPGALPVKTRLVPLLGEAGARDLHCAMLRETLVRARVLDPVPTVACSPPDVDPRAGLPGLGPCTYLRLAATGGAACLEEALARSYAGLPLVALGADAPDLPEDLLRSAARAAAEGDAALVPTPDGGFSCLALPRPFPGLGGAFRFGGGDSCTAVAAFLERQEVAVRRLPEWPDVDTPDDLARWRRRGGGQRPPGPPEVRGVSP